MIVLSDILISLGILCAAIALCIYAIADILDFLSEDI